MSDLVVIAFPTEAKAEEVRQKLLAMQKEYLIELDNAVGGAHVKDHQRKHQTKSTDQHHGCRCGYWYLLGLADRPDLFDAASRRCPWRSVSSTLSGYLTDISIDGGLRSRTAAAVQPGTAALFVLVRKVTADKVLDRLEGEGGTVPEDFARPHEGSRVASGSGRGESGGTGFAS